jgi:hypothetical protein
MSGAWAYQILKWVPDTLSLWVVVAHTYFFIRKCPCTLGTVTTTLKVLYSCILVLEGCLIVFFALFTTPKYLGAQEDMGGFCSPS